MSLLGSVACVLEHGNVSSCYRGIATSACAMLPSKQIVDAEAAGSLLLWRYPGQVTDVNQCTEKHSEAVKAHSLGSRKLGDTLFMNKD